MMHSLKVMRYIIDMKRVLNILMRKRWRLKNVSHKKIIYIYIKMNLTPLT